MNRDEDGPFMAAAPPLRDQPGPISAGADPLDFTAGTSAIRQTAENTIGQQARRGQIVLFVVGGIQLAFMVFFTLWFLQVAQHVEDFSQRLMAAVSWTLGLMLGGLFVSLGFWARRDPLLASAIGLGIYLAANLIDVLLYFGYGIFLLPGVWGYFYLLRLFIIVLLIDAIRAGLAYKRIVNRLILETRQKMT